MQSRLFSPSNPELKKTKSPYVFLRYDPISSISEKNPVNRLVYSKNLKLYGEPCNYTLHINEDYACSLTPNHKLLPDAIGDSPVANTKPQGKFIYIVKLDENGRPKLIIGQGSHYHLANMPAEIEKIAKQNVKNAINPSDIDVVLLGGDIYFDSNGALDKFDDASGGFHIHPDLSQDEQFEQAKSILHIIEQVGLPLSKFKPFNAKIYDGLLDLSARFGSARI